MQWGGSPSGRVSCPGRVQIAVGTAVAGIGGSAGKDGFDLMVLIYILEGVLVCAAHILPVHQDVRDVASAEMRKA